MKFFKRLIIPLILVGAIFAQDMSNLSKIANEKSKLGVSSSLVDLKKLAENDKKAQSDRLQTMNDYIPLEGKVDDSQYIIGPHDVLSLTYIIADSDESETIDLPVNPDGNILIPSFGALDISGLSLLEAKKLIKEKFQEIYVVHRLDINLVNARVFRAHVTGFIQLPGAYNVMASFRVARLIEMAGGKRPNADISRLRIVRNNDTLHFNLNDYYLNGNIDSNPFLLDGDIVHIPSINSMNESIFLGGAVQRNGKYSIRDGIKVSEIIPDILDMDQNSDLSQIKVIRAGEAHFIDYDNNEDFSLQGNDQLIIPVQIDSVFVTGHVAQGGKYQYIPHQDFKAYLAMAGGPDEKGSMKRVLLYRNGVKHDANEIDAVLPGDVIYVKASYFTRALDIISILSQSATVAIAVYTINKE